MMAQESSEDPTRLLRYRDSIYATDLLICAIAYFDFFTILKPFHLSFEEICTKLDIAIRPADVMLSLFVSMELIRKCDNHYQVTDISKKYLVSNSPDSLVPYYCSLKNRPQCLEFYEVLKLGKPSGWSSKKSGNDWIKSMHDTEFADSFTNAMDSRGTFLATKLADKLDLSNNKSLLDIAGGSGIYACSLATRYPHIRASILEILPVNLATCRSINAKNMAKRVSVIEGNMFELIPEGFDVHLFANAFHDWNTDFVKTLAKNSFVSLSNGGKIAIFDAHLNESKNGPLSIAEYSCLLMHSTEGRCYSTLEIKEILTYAGFIKIEITDVAADRTLITGIKPS